ncbi:MAG: hypothetical protein V1729_02220 [Candidatus Woesearchaeota archaeon]
MVSSIFRKAKCVDKRAQSAMEFLMTYGWAILVVLAAIGALAYFGVLSPAKFFPESCTLSSTSGVGCMDFKLTETTGHFLLVNGGGRDIIVNNMTVGPCSTSFDRNFPDGQSYLFNLTGCSFAAKGSNVKYDMTISYTAIISGFSKSASGSVTAVIG